MIFLGENGKKNLFQFKKKTILLHKLSGYGSTWFQFKTTDVLVNNLMKKRRSFPLIRFITFYDFFARSVFLFFNEAFCNVYRLYNSIVLFSPTFKYYDKVFGWREGVVFFTALVRSVDSF